MICDRPVMQAWPVTGGTPVTVGPNTYYLSSSSSSLFFLHSEKYLIVYLLFIFNMFFKYY
jgi:hypothetical protein